jgi:hypothetical protein
MQVRIVRENLRVAQSTQRSYANRRRRELSFEVGDFVYLKVSPMSFEVAYQLELLLQLSDVHDVFYVSQLKKCFHVPEEHIPLEDLNACEDLSYQRVSCQDFGNV